MNEKGRMDQLRARAGFICDMDGVIYHGARLLAGVDRFVAWLERQGMRKLGCRREETAIVGDRMDTDILAGLEAEIATVLVLSGVTRRDDLGNFAYKPQYVLDGGRGHRACLIDRACLLGAWLPWGKSETRSTKHETTLKRTRRQNHRTAEPLRWVRCRLSFTFIRLAVSPF